MKNYTFDMTLKAAVTVEAESEEEAERIVKGVLDDAASFTAWEGVVGCDDDVSGECTLIGEPTLAQIDGEDVDATPGERVVINTAPDDIAHAPDVAPHRFSQFHKGARYAYARGLEVSPVHLPTALDAMAKDGWFLVAIFGQTDSKHVGFIFERRP